MSDRELIAGLEAAVSAAPGNVPLRLHLIEHLITAERAAEGLAHSEAILRAQPDNVRAFEAAGHAAAAINDVRASAFHRVATALRGAGLGVAPEPAAAIAAPEAPAIDVAQSLADIVIAADEPVAPPQEESPEPPVATSTSAPAVLEPPSPAPTPTPDVEEPAWGPVDEESPETEEPREFTVDPSSIQRPKLALRDIIGVSDVKQRIQAVVLDPLRSENGNGQGNVTHGGGYLMFGPPGCGKGFFARVVAGEIGAGYLPIRLGQAHEWPGDPRQNIQRIFEAARDAAPCVLFLDEVDRAGRRFDDPNHPIDRGVVTRLVTELDTAGANSGVYVFAGAVSPWDVDMALRSEGRLDRTLLVLPPDEAAREAILRFHLRDRRLAGVDVGWIVQRTQHFSGDDLLLLCETASNLAANDALDGDLAIGPGHVTRALREVRPTSPAWFSNVVDHAIAANHGGIYDEVLAYIDEHQLV